MKTILLCLILSCAAAFHLEAMNLPDRPNTTYAPIIVVKQTKRPHKENKQKIQKKDNEPDYKKLYLELRFTELVHPGFILKFRQNHFDFSEYKGFIDAGLDINFFNTFGRTTLMESCIEGCADIQVTQWLIAQGANINLLGSKYQQNAAMFTTLDTSGIRTDLFINRPELIVDQQDIKGNTLLLYLLFKPSAWFYFPAEQYKRRTLAQIAALLQRHANPRLANNEGITPLQAAQKTGDPRAIELIENALKQ